MNLKLIEKMKRLLHQHHVIGSAVYRKIDVLHLPLQMEFHRYSQLTIGYNVPSIYDGLKCHILKIE